jgi:phospholipid/cholesterol/gamma-HCH transport system substrate-binding protein
MSRHRDRGPAVNPAIVGLIASAAMFGLLLFAFTNVTLFQQKMQVNAEVSSADTLAPGADVEVAGVKVGTVKSIGKGNQSGALVAMEINTQQTAIYKGATAQIRPHGVFGPKFVQLVPGNAAAGGFPNGGTIDRANTAVSVDFEQILNQLDDNTRQSLQTFLYEFGTWQDNRGQDQGAVIDNLNVVTAQLTPPLQVIANRKAQLGNLLDHNAVATETLAGSPLDQIIHENNDVLTALDNHQSGLVNVVVHGNNVLNDIDQITAGNNVANLRALLPNLPTLLDALSRFSTDLGQGVNHLNPVIVPQYGQPASDIGLAILRTRDAFGECDVSDDSSADTAHANNVKVVPCYGADGKPYVDPATGHVAHHHVKVLLGLHTNGTPGSASENESGVLCGPDSGNAARGASPAFTCTTDPLQSPASAIPVAGGPVPPAFGASSRVSPGASGTGSLFNPVPPAGLLNILAGQ